jgi:hypothetical protein
MRGLLAFSLVLFVLCTLRLTYHTTIFVERMVELAVKATR